MPCCIIQQKVTPWIHPPREVSIREGPIRGQKSTIYNMEEDWSPSAADQDLDLYVLSEATVRSGIWVTLLIEGVLIRMEGLLFP